MDKPGAVSFDTVRKIARTLPNAEETTSYGAPAFKTEGQMFVRWREELDAIVIGASFEQRDAMMADDPRTYFITDHYRDYPWVLVRLSEVQPDALPDLLRMSWRFAREKKKTKRVAAKHRNSNLQ